jgi:hypothetical protein
MSYEFLLKKVCDNKVIWDDHIVEDDNKTVVINVPLINQDVVVRINDFERPRDFLNEILLREDISSQVTGSNRTFFVSQGPIYNGLKLGQLATRFQDVVVKVKVTNEDVSEQFTGVENYFFTQSRPLMKSNSYDFNSFIDVNDFQITKNGRPYSPGFATSPKSCTDIEVLIETYSLIAGDYFYIDGSDTTNQTLELIKGNTLANYDSFQVDSSQKQLGLSIIPSTYASISSLISINNLNVGDKFYTSDDSDTAIPSLAIAKAFLTTIPLATNDSFEVGMGNTIIYLAQTVRYSATRIESFDAITGRISFKEKPIISDVITITYFYQAQITNVNALQSNVTIKQLVQVGQDVKISYFSQQSDGWYLKNSTKAVIPGSQDVVFRSNKKTNRKFVENEVVQGSLGTTNFTGSERTFFTKYFPLLPLFQTFESTSNNTLNNAVIVTINGAIYPVAGVNSATGEITLYQYPKPTDIILISYYYQTDLISDRISLDYYVNSTYCDKCSDYTDLIDYTIDQLGQYKTIKDSDKLIQDLKKIIITVLGSDPVATWYGTDFAAMIGTKIFPEITKTKILNEIVTVLSKLKSAQIQQEEYQTVTNLEFLNTIKSTSITQSTSDPSYFTVNVNITTQANTVVPVSNVPIQIS